MPRGKSVPYPQKARERIKANSILEKLQKHVLSDSKIVDGEVFVEGEVMSNSQIRAAEILLKKCIPDMKQTEVVGEGGGPVRVQDMTRLAEAESLLRSYGIDPDEIT